MRYNTFWKDARKAFQCGKGLMGLSEGRISFVIDNKGVIRYVFYIRLPTAQSTETQSACVLVVMSWTL